MGCDIHFYVEKPTPSGWEHVPAPAGVDDFADRCGHQPRFYRDRDYLLFSWLAGVRDWGAVQAIEEPRGMPGSVSVFVHHENTLRIVPGDDDEDSEEGTCTPEEVSRWGVAVLADGRAVHPDWHSHSWFTVNELTVALDALDNPDETFVAFKKTLALIIQHAGSDARVVFWFDC